MASYIEPTDADAEAEKGHVAVWLDPEDMRWLVRQLGRNDDSEQGGRIRFRLLTALHKAGLPSDPWSEPEE